jgi:hypothetical protein
VDLHILLADFDSVIVAALDLVVDIEFCINNPLSANHISQHQAKLGPQILDQRHTPLSRFISLLPRALNDVVAQDVRNLDRMVDLHASVDGRAAILFKVLASFLASSH